MPYLISGRSLPTNLPCKILDIKIFHFNKRYKLNVMNKKIKPYEKTEAAYKEILESKKKAYDQKNAELRKQRMAKETEKSKN